MSKKRMPKIWKKKISDGGKTRSSLMVGKEQRLAADEIFECKKFHNGTKAAVVYKEKKSIKFAIMHLDAPMTEFADFKPAPTLGFSIVITGKKTEDWVSVIFRSGNRYYVLDSSVMQIYPLENEAEADAIIDARGILI